MRDIDELLTFSFAEDIEAEWDMYMEDGYSVQEATSLLLDQYAGMLDEEENVQFYVTLGVLQAHLEELDCRVKKEINEMIGTKVLEGCFHKSLRSKNIIQLLKKQCR